MRTELGSVPCPISLQTRLIKLPVGNVLFIRNSEELIALVEAFHSRKRSLASLDIKDLYYALDRSVLLSRVRHVLDDYLVRFQVAPGIDIEGFMCLL